MEAFFKLAVLTEQLSKINKKLNSIKNSDNLRPFEKYCKYINLKKKKNRLEAEIYDVEKEICF